MRIFKTAQWADAERARFSGQRLPSRALAPAPAMRSGFTLLEVLVALIVISVGILGVTALQSAAINGQLLARNQDTAFNVIHDALDRMQNNAENIQDYIKGNYNQPFTVTVNSNSPNPPASSERPSAVIAAGDYDEIYRAMYTMKMTSGTLTIKLTNDSPVTGADTAEASLVWNYKGDKRKCVVNTIIIKK